MPPSPKRSKCSSASSRIRSSPGALPRPLARPGTVKIQGKRGMRPAWLAVTGYPRHFQLRDGVTNTVISLERTGCAMKVTVERSELLKSLGHVHRVVERRNTIPILAHVLIRAHRAKLS